MPKRKRSYKTDEDPTKWTFDFTVYPSDGKMLFGVEELALYLAKFEAWKSDATRLRLSKEVCPDTKRDHLQCKITWRVGKRWAQMQKLMDPIHFEVSKSLCFAYCAKLGSELLIEHDGRKQGNRSDLQKCLDSAAAGASTRELFTDFGPTMVRYQAGIERAKTALKEHEQLASYTLADFGAWEPFTDWSQSIVLLGPSNTGKTEFALAHFKNPKLVTDIDELLDFDPGEHDGIVFDDMDFNSQSRNAQIAIVDQSMPRAIRCRYRSPVIPRGTKKIFTCNNWPVSIDDAAIKRRCRLVIATDRDTELVTQG